MLILRGFGCVKLYWGKAVDLAAAERLTVFIRKVISVSQFDI